MRAVWLLLIMSFSITGNAQVTDNEIVKCLFSHNASAIEPTLDSLGVYYHLHLERVKGEKGEQVILSIADTTNYNTLKLYIINISSEGNPIKIIINFKHEIYQHMKDLDNLTGVYSKHVGKFSTDVTFYSPQKISKVIITKEFQDYEYAKRFADKLPQRSIYYYNLKYYYVGVVKSEDENFIHFEDGKTISKDKIVKVR